MATVFLLAKVGDRQTDEQIRTLAEKLETAFPNRARSIGVDSHLVAAPIGTVSRDIGESIGLTDMQGSATGTYIITPITAYWGIADRSIWEWISTMVAADD